MPQRPFEWTNVVFIAIAHLLAVAAIVYMAVVHFSWWTLGLGALWFQCCNLSISGGYHRLFAHPTYKAAWPLRLFYLLFGAASVQNSALKWAADHRVHHAFTDREQDPYNIRKGFWWAHIGWVLRKDPPKPEVSVTNDLMQDPLIRFQERYYVLLAGGVGAVVPAAIGMAWGDAIGALLVVGFLRLVLQWHVTFSINSMAHCLGSQSYSKRVSARDSFWTAVVSMGEGYHNFHHRFQNDYRNGVRWYHYDPSKWFIWSLSHLGVTSALRRTPKIVIEQARLEVSNAPGD